MNAPAITFDPAGNGRCLYTELIDLSALGTLEITRASTIEFHNAAQVWEVKSPEGALLFSHPSRTTCLDWEHQHFNDEQIHPQGVDLPLGLRSERPIRNPAVYRRHHLLRLQGVDPPGGR